MGVPKKKKKFGKRVQKNFFKLFAGDFYRSNTLHCKFFPHKKCGGSPCALSQNIPCKVHVIITGITCTTEIPTFFFDFLQKLQGLRVYMQSP